MSAASDAHERSRLKKTCNLVSKELAEEQATEVILLSDDQLLIRKHMLPNPDPAGFKTPTSVPAADGYAIYLSCRLPTEGEERPEQRVSFPTRRVTWDAATMTLRMNRTTLDQSWNLVNRVGECISVTAYCGSQQVFDQVDRVLALAATCLLG